MPSRITSARCKSSRGKHSQWSRRSWMGPLLVTASAFMLMNWGDAGIATSQQPSTGIVTTVASSLADSPHLAQHVPGELLVKFRSAVSSASAMAFASALGATELQTLAIDANNEVYHLKLPEGVSVEQAMTQYRMHPAVEYVEPNYIRQFMTIPNDPEFTKLWGLRNTG